MKNKKFLLVSPLNPLGEGSSFPPLGLATIASYIPENYSVTIIDEGEDGLTVPENVQADIVGISVNTLTAHRAYEISEKFMNLGVPTILGGIHPTVMPQEAANYATSVVIGNGEPVMGEIIHDFERGILKKFYTPPLFDLSLSITPRRDLFSGKYFTGNLQTSRGCPFSCKFCSVHKVHGREYRSKPFSVIETDLVFFDKSIALIVDDNFFGIGPKAEKRTEELLRILKEHKISWIGQTSINIANNDRILKLCKESGAIAFYIGFESLNEEFLKSVGKGINLKQTVASYKDVIRKIQDNGICVLGSFIYGTDFDTRDGLKKLLDFIMDSNVDTTYVKPLTPFPGTEIYDELKSRLIRPDYWMQDPYPIFTFKPARISADDLMAASLDFIKLYTLPKSLLRFGKSLAATGNLRGSAMSFLSNYGDYRRYRDYYQKNAEKITSLIR